MILYIPNIMDRLAFRVIKMEESRIRVEIMSEEMGEMATLYYERGKNTYNHKPIGMDEWLCVDAKVWGNLYEIFNVTPRQILDECQKHIREYRLSLLK